MEKNSIIIGMQVGSLIARMRRTEKVPVAYLYNGVRMPPLPEWNMVKYPHVMCDAEGMFFVMQSPCGMDYLHTDGMTYIAVPPGEEWLAFKYLSGTGKFSTIFGGDNAKDTYQPLINDPHWSNYDILNANGSVFLPASDPIPVYE